MSTSSRLFAGLFAHGEAAEATSDRALLAAMVDVELALVRALVGVGLAPVAAGEDLPGSDALVALLDVAEIARSTAQKGTPVPGLISALREALDDHPAASQLHRGATSQDIVDTALMLVARRALEPLLADLGAAAELCARLAERHRASVKPGRTLLQQAVPLTFGLTAAGWLSGLDGARGGLAEVREHELAVQLGGAVGTLAPLEEHGLAVMERVAAELGLLAPPLAWHTIRLAPARLASALAIALGIMGKIARDVVLSAQTEVAEASEGGGPGRGGSSTMPHKRNPVGSVAVVACAQRGPGLAASVLASMLQEHERGAGGWQAEWEPLLELLRLCGSAAASLREVLDGLQVNPERMRENLALTHGLSMSESVVSALTSPLGRARAQELVAQAAQQRRPLRESLLALPELSDVISPEELDAALEPESYLGVTAELIDRALAAHRGA